MHEQVLNREFVLEQMEFVEDALRSLPEERRGIAAPRTFDEGAMSEIAVELRKAREKEIGGSSGQENYDDDPDARRGEEPAPIDDTVFMSHDPIMSNFQSALDEYLFTDVAAAVDTVPMDDPRRGADDFVAVTDRSVAGSPMLAKTDDGRRLFNKFSETDPRWIASLFAMGIRKLRGKHPFKKVSADLVKMGNKARLILVADWATGLPRAINVANQMRIVVEQGMKAGIEQHVIHLGDVYYSGWESEYRRRFLPYWPVAAGEESDRLVSWCLNGNHDMYSGGHAYFDYLLADRRFAKQQQSSFFALRNDNWNILGLDTAYEDKGLIDPQAEWIEQILKGANRKSLLLSHHQLFSVYEGSNDALVAKIEPYLKDQSVDAWFWGHEHRCVFYKAHQNVKNARLIGNGGVPVYMTHAENAAYEPPAYFEYRKFIRTGLEKWAYMGFAVVDLDGAKAAVRYIDEFGTEFHREEIA